MILIAHRGNINGPNPERENTVSYIQEALDKGYQNLYYSYKQDGYLDEEIHLKKGYDLKKKSQKVPGFSMI